MEEYKKPAGSGFATASLVFGIAALVSTFLFPVLLPFFFGGLSIILGILSRGANRKHSNHALGGIIVSASAMTINAAIFIFAVFVVFSNPEMTKEYWDTVTQTYEQMTGQDLDEVLEGYGLEMR